jgi:hypothetical protein
VVRLIIQVRRTLSFELSRSVRCTVYVLLSVLLSVLLGAYQELRDDSLCI